MLDPEPTPFFASRSRTRPDPSPAEICRLTLTHTAQDFGLDAAMLDGALRGTPAVALARQIAMYLAHVGFALPFAAIGRAFGRDRTTVSYACRVIENRRDDIAFDSRMVRLEKLCRAAMGNCR